MGEPQHAGRDAGDAGGSPIELGPGPLAAEPQPQRQILGDAVEVHVLGNICALDQAVQCVADAPQQLAVLLTEASLSGREAQVGELLGGQRRRGEQVVDTLVMVTVHEGAERFQRLFVHAAILSSATSKTVMDG